MADMSVPTVSIEDADLDQPVVHVIPDRPPTRRRRTDTSPVQTSSASSSSSTSSDSDASPVKTTKKARKAGSSNKSKSGKKGLAYGDHFSCEGRRVPDGFLYHVVGVQPDSDGINSVPRLLVRPGAPPSWRPTNAGFFIGRHVAKHVPAVPQYWCPLMASSKCKQKESAQRKCEYISSVRTRVPVEAALAWPAYTVDFAECATTIDSAWKPATTTRAPLLSELYNSCVAVGESNIVQLANFMRSEGTDFALLQELEQSPKFILDAFIDGVHNPPSAAAAAAVIAGTAAPGIPPAGVVLELDACIASPLLLTTHCLVLDRDVAFAPPPGPVRLIDSIPPVMRLDGMPDTDTLRRWAAQTTQRCNDFNEPILSWCVSSVQFGSNVGSNHRNASITTRRLLDLIVNQVRLVKDRSFHDAWIEWVFRVLALPFVAVTLKQRRVVMACGELPLADLPPPGKAHQKPVLALHQEAPNNMFNLAAVVCAALAGTALGASASSQVRMNQ